MRGMHPSPVSLSEHRENVRVANQYVDELYYNVERFCGHGAVVGGAAFQHRAAGFVSWVMLPNAADTAWTFPVRMRADYQTWGLRWHIMYTSNVGSTSNFDLILRAYPIGAGVNLVAPATSFAANVSIPGPGVAEDVLETTYVDTAAIFTKAESWQSFQFIRLGASDPNANELRVLATRLELIRI